MRVAVVTPYYREDLAVLSQCNASVAEQTAPCEHVMVADGFPKDEVSTWRVAHVKLPRAHADNGNLGRCIGSLMAVAEGFDAIAYLDADNWYASDHIESLVRLHQETGADICTSSRTLHRLDGSPFPPIEDDFDGVTQCDTSEMFVTRSAFDIVSRWVMPPQLTPIGDQVIWATIRSRGLKVAHTGKRTLAFRSQYEHHYRMAGEQPPAGLKGASSNNGFLDSFRHWKSLTESGAHERLGIGPFTLPAGKWGAFIRKALAL